MSDIIGLLRLEHSNMAKLIGLLDREIKVFDEGEMPDYDLINGILTYNLSFPDTCHHPKEDLIYQKLKARDPAMAERLGDLEQEHRDLKQLTLRLATAVREVLAEVQMPRDWVVQVAREYVEFWRRHMAKEEEEFLPAAERILKAEDWADIDAAAFDRPDALFGPKVEEPYERLYDEIVRFA